MKRNDEFKKSIITYTLSCLLILNLIGSINKKQSDIKVVANCIESYSIDDLKDLIYNSNNLTDEEKDYLFNKDFLIDILPIINESLATRIQYQKHFSDITINNYEKGTDFDNFNGYYSTTTPNTLFIKGYNDFDDNKDTIAHEFIHLCQDLFAYNLITESCAEIISFEYYPECKVNCYTKQVKLLKKIMEIIGPDIIWNYSFTGNFKPVEEAVKPYLSDNEYLDFINCLSFDYNNKEESDLKFKRMDELIIILYENKYNKKYEDNIIFNLIDNERTLVRYYFNKRLINKENSYYIDYANKEYRKVSYEEAIEKKYFMAYSIKYEDITNERAFELAKEEKYNLVRIINYSNNNICLKKKSEKGYHTFISGIIDGVTYQDADVDELAKKGIISISYRIATLKLLTAEEYINKECEEGAQIYELYSKKDMELHDDYIEGYFPKQVYIEPINSNLENDSSLSLTKK